MSDPDLSQRVNESPWVDPDEIADREIFDEDDLLAEDEDDFEDDDLEPLREAEADASPYDDYDDAALLDDPNVEPNLVRQGFDEDADEDIDPLDL